MNTSLKIMVAISLLILVGCGGMSPALKKDIPYGKNVGPEKAFDCAISAARDTGFAPTFTDRKTGTFNANMGSGGTIYGANFLVDKNTSTISVALQGTKFGALVQASPEELDKIINLFQTAYQKYCGK